MAHADKTITRLSLGAAGLALLGACTTPAIDYTARIPAGSLEAASYRNVAVNGFRGAEGDWFAAAFEDMLSAAVLDGEAWFQVARYGGVPEGVYEGTVEVDWIEEEHSREIDRQCVEWDGPFDCERRADVVKHCIELDVEVSVSPALFDLETGELIWTDTYSGDASDRDCETLGEVGTFRDGRWPRDGYRDTHRYGGYGSRWSRRFGIDELVREAAGEMLSDIRTDIAPYNRRSKARLMTEAVDPVVRGDARFALAVEAAKNDNFLTACTMFGELAAENPTAPAAKFNLGACAEAEGDFETAQLLYAEVAQMGQALPDVVQDALKRTNTRRAGEFEIDGLVGGYGEVPEKPGS